MDEFEKELKIGFLQEVSQNLTDTEECFLSLETNPNDSSLIERIFRLAHNIKGSARAVGYLEMGEFTHRFESLLLQIKIGEIQITPTVVSLLLECNDHLKSWVAVLSSNLDETFDSTDLTIKIEKYFHDVPEITVSQEDIDLNLAAQQFEAINPVASIHPVQDPMAAPDVPKSPLKKSFIVEESIRVDVNRMEDLMNYVGELVILQTVLSQQRFEIQSPLIQKTITQLSKITKDIQDITMGLRMVPLKQTFQKVQRIVRDAANTLGKDIIFHMEGEETELDKNVIENLGDPLVHLVRNAVDHGIESREERIRKGKNPVGNIYLKAFHAGGRIYIEIKDDGKGLDPVVLKKSAVAKGLLSADQHISDIEAQRLIFAPGFTTKSEVSEISGRGVGMDVVKTNIERHLHGEVNVTSEVGAGTHFSIQLPLTLAIIEGIIVYEYGHKFILPLSHVHESLRLDKSLVNERSGIGYVLNLRGEQIPLLRLGHELHLSTKETTMDSAMAVVVRSSNAIFAIAVDDIIGQHQVVIKNLGSEVRNMKGVMGGAILGDGKVALILDLQELVQKTKKQNQTKSDLRGAA